MHGVCNYSKLSAGNATMLGLKLKNGLLMEIISEILRLSHIWLSLRRLSHIWLILTIGVKGTYSNKLEYPISRLDPCMWTYAMGVRESVWCT